MNEVIYIKIDFITYKRKEVFYKKPINTELHKATEYTNNYEYYVKETESDENPKYLGKFIEFSMYRGSSYYDDCNYPIIVFEKGNVFENKKENIYCKGIPNSCENLDLIEDMYYDDFPLYYKK
jgi:hypothetical protein